MPEPADPKLYAPSNNGNASRVPVDRSYVELNIATNFSFLRGASHPDELVNRAVELGYGAIGVTDVNTLAGIVRAYAAATKAGMKLITGAHLTLMDGPEVLVWVRHRDAYAALCRLLTLGKRRTEKGECLLSLGDLIEQSDGFLVGVLPPADLIREDVSQPIQQLKDAFGSSLSLVGCCDYTIDPARRIKHLLDLSKRTGVPIVATNHVHYHDPTRQPLQDVLTCTRHGVTIHNAGYKLFPNGERYLKSPEQMRKLWRDHPKAIARSVEIAGQCTFTLDELKYQYPDEIAPPGMTPMAYLTDLTWRGAAERFPDGVPEKVQNTIEHELTLVARLKYEAFFLTVYDLVRVAKERGILCQGRGSAANSVICYCIGVTNVDPRQIDVLFERFVSDARDEPPDIDVDFEHERREEIIQYIYGKYGRDRAAMTAEVITYRGRSAVRDVGKALGFAEDQLDQIARQLDWWHRGTITNEQIQSIGLDPADRKIRQLIEITAQLLGFPRHLGQHSGGMVMTRGPLSDLVPIENASMQNRTVIEWDKDDLETLRMMKVDVLALGMLTCIRKTMEIVNGRSPDAMPLQLHTLPREDAVVYEMIQDADTVGVFQIESRAQMSMLPRLKPKCYYDLVIEVAIVRPGPIQGDMVHPYLRRRDGSEAVVYPQEELRAVLGKTLGVPLFQEQAMRVVMVAAKFSADEANAYRKAMAAWKQGGAVVAFEDRIKHTMIERGYTPEFADNLCLQLRGFGSYGFPESHAASFAHLVYVSCWLKRYHPAAFAAGLLNSQPMGFYAPAQIVRDAKEHGVDVRPVDVNHSEWDTSLEGDGSGAARRDMPKERWGSVGPALRLGLRMIKGLREDELRRCVEARHHDGPFESIEQLHRRTRLSSAAIDKLAEADAFGSLNRSRRAATWEALAVDEMPATLFDTTTTPFPIEAEQLPKMSRGQEVIADYASTSLSLKAHPMSLMREELRQRGVITSSQLADRKVGWIKVAGLVLLRQRPGTASGVVFMTLEDETGVVNLIVRPKIFDQYLAAARHSRILLVEGRVERNGKVIHVMARRLFDISDQLSQSTLFRSRDFH